MKMYLCLMNRMRRYISGLENKMTDRQTDRETEKEDMFVKSEVFLFFPKNFKFTHLW